MHKCTCARVDIPTYTQTYNYISTYVHTLYNILRMYITRYIQTHPYPTHTYVCTLSIHASARMHARTHARTHTHTHTEHTVPGVQPRSKKGSVPFKQPGGKTAQHTCTLKYKPTMHTQTHTTSEWQGAHITALHSSPAGCWHWC